MILHGDCLEVLRRLPEASVHCVVTSPPYWSLRDYGVPPTVWGGDPRCKHVWASAGTKEGYGAKKKWQHTVNGRNEVDESATRARRREDGGWTEIEQGQWCIFCKAWRGCLGLEPTPELYVTHLVSVFTEVLRVLRHDGTCWLNLGDCYASNNGSGSGAPQTGLVELSNRTDPRRKPRERNRDTDGQVPRGRKVGTPAGLKSKDLVGIPWRVAFALQASGWYLRSDIIWAKPNPMPESTKDRPTKSHEYVFLLAKSEHYFYDADAIREGVTGNAHHRGDGAHAKARTINRNLKTHHRTRQNASFSAAVTALVASRNRRSVWTLPTMPFKGAHFATFPPRLVEPCILAGTSEHGCCSACGAPFARVVKLGPPLRAQQVACGGDARGRYAGTATKVYADAGAQDPSAVKARILEGMRERLTVGWRPTCRHTLRTVEPCTVLDPFAGTGTTGMVAARLGRAFVEIELNAEYIAIAERRSTPAPAEASA